MPQKKTKLNINYISELNIPINGINSTDALITQMHFLYIDTLTNLSLKVADINLSNTINSTDALYIREKFFSPTFISMKNILR